MQTSAHPFSLNRWRHQHAVVGIRPFADQAGPFTPGTANQAGRAPTDGTLLSPNHYFDASEVGALDAPEAMPCGSCIKHAFVRLGRAYPAAVTTFTFRGYGE